MREYVKYVIILVIPVIKMDNKIVYNVHNKIIDYEINKIDVYVYKRL